MRYEEFIPSEPVRAHVAVYWRFSAGQDIRGPITHTIPPDGATSLVFSLRRRTLLYNGARTTPHAITVAPGDEYRGARLWPGAGRALVPVPLASLRNRVVPADGASAAWTTVLIERLTQAADDGEANAAWDELLGRQLACNPSVDREVLASALVAIRAAGQVTVAGLARMVRLSPRQLRRRFLKASGLTPKELLAARRVRAALVRAVDDSTRHWTDIAASTGFSDQAHLSREVQRLLGSSPSSIRPYLRSMHGTLIDR